MKMLSETVTKDALTTGIESTQRLKQENEDKDEQNGQNADADQMQTKYLKNEKVVRNETEIENNLTLEEETYFEESRMEQMELENYSLRKRCKRLENIVSQLLENKGKEEDEHDVPVLVKMGKKIGIEVFSEKVSDSDPSEITTTFSKVKEENDKDSTTTQIPIFQRRLSSTDQPKMKPLFISVSDFSAESLAAPSKPAIKSLSPKNSYMAHRPVSHIHIPTTLQRDYSDLDRMNYQPRPTLIPPTNLEASSSLNEIPSKEKKCLKRKSNNEDDLDISSEEMEQRNEVFRSTYYLSQNKSSNASSKPSRSAPADLFDRRKSRSPSFQYSDISPNNYLSRYKSFPKSPENTSPNSHYAPYHKPEYNEKHDSYHHHRLTKHTDTYHHLDHYDFSRYDRSRIEQPFSSHRSSNLRPIIHDPNSHIPRSPKDIKPFVLPPIETEKDRHHNNIINFGHTQTRMRTYTPLGRKPMHRYSSGEQELGKYNSDFYTKLPPKLHIVESQNETGVTLTWNTTSKCDSSLVKSYQLFARELFGHKVGTMKRIGVVDALPLPMSCNIDKLKYHIKYKFAVCAIDIYGRYGKMSNFTGKFELKPKGPFTKLPPSQAELIDGSDKEESRLEIII